jgi:hypothetical protein
MKFHGNPFNGSRVDRGGRTDSQGNRRTEMTKLIVSFRDYENGPKNTEHYVCLKS